MQKNKSLILISSIILLLFSSCAKSSNQGSSQQIINLKYRLYWAACDKNSTIEDAESLRFHKFNSVGLGNIKSVIEPGQEYIWLMVVFPVPEHLRKKSLALLITYILPTKSGLTELMLAVTVSFRQMKAAFFGEHTSIPFLSR